MRARDATIDDAEQVGALFRDIFTQTFRHLYSEADYQTFMRGFTIDRWRAEIGDPAFGFRLVEDEAGRAVAYIKVGPNALPAGEDERAIELYNLYLRDEARGTGIADDLLDWGVRKARDLGGDTMFLSVFIDNHRARRFYDRHGWTEVGPYDFMVGDHVDHDIIMRLDL